MKQFKIVIAGLGGRGYHTYAKYQKLHPERFKIVAIADIDKEKVKLCGDEFDVPMDMRFDSAESMFEKGKLGDIAIIATQDGDHKIHAIMALDKGYDLLLEKPVAETVEDCKAIEAAALKANKLVVVCHVLRYTTFFRVIKDLIDKKEIGEVMNITAFENVSYWHQAHSFIRGNWRSDRYTTPMIVQKCCHDFDMISWLMNRKCEKVTSFGALTYFKKENAPAGATLRCKDCKAKDCPYNAYEIYLHGKQIGLESVGNIYWPNDILVENPTKEKLIKAIDEGPYGRCVFHSDNNVVDHEVTNMLFEEDKTATLIMTGFTDKNYRQYKVNGTLGQILADQDLNTVTLTKFGEDPVVYDINKLASDLSGHGGGDNKMLDEMLDSLEKGTDVSSTIKVSIETHLMAFAAEESRLNGGKLVDVKNIH